MTAAVLSPWRTDIITGSRIPAILELSPHQTREGVLREMVRDYFDEPREFTGNIATEFGRRHEPDAIAEYEMTRGVKVTRAGSEQELIMHPDVPFLGVTPDGLVGHEGIVEAKCPFRAGYSHIKERPDIAAQIMLQTECTGRAWGDLAVWRRDANISISRLPHDPDWLPSILGELAEFMAEYRATIADEKLAAKYRKPLVNQRADQAWCEAAVEYLECLYLKNARQAEEDAAKARLVELAGDERSTRGAGVLLTRSEPKGSIAYKEAVEKLCPDADLENFRGKPKKTTWTVRKASDTTKEKAA